MNHKLVLISSLLLTFACTNETVDKRVNENLNEYIAAKNFLVNNLNQIDESRNYTRIDSILRKTQDRIFASNKYYLENTLVLEYPSLKSLLKLWEQNLIESYTVVESLSLRSDSVICFTIKSDIGTFSGTDHLLIFDPNNHRDYYNDQETEIKFEEQIKEDWFYIIQKKYYVD